MTWIPDASVTVNGVNYDSKTLNGVQVSFGRTTIWEQPRAGYAVVSILNTTNSDFGFQPNQSLVITIDNSSGTPITIFTGKVTDIRNNIDAAGTVNKVAIQTLTAISPLANMSRKNITGTYGKEYDDVRMTNILTNAGVTIDSVDTPGVYEFQSVAGSTTDAYTIAAKYAQMGFGYIYDTPTGKVGYANESHRFNDATANGYFNISKSYLLSRDISSSKNLNNLLNDVLLSYRAGTVTSSDTTSQASYGVQAGSITTELHNLTEAQYQADRYITLRATPRTNLGQFTIPLDAPNVTDADRNALISIYHGKPIQVQNLPTAIKNQTYRGFVEGWTFIIYQNSCQLTISSTDATLSIVPTRWQDVAATLKWSDVGATIQWTTYDDI